MNTTSCRVITRCMLQHPYDSVSDLRSGCNPTLRHTQTHNSRPTIQRPTYSSNDGQYSHMPAGHAESHYCATDRPSHLCFSAMARKQTTVPRNGSLFARINLATATDARPLYCEPQLKTFDYLITSDLQTCIKCALTAKCKSASQNTARSLQMYGNGPADWNSKQSPIPSTLLPSSLTPSPCSPFSPSSPSLAKNKLESMCGLNTVRLNRNRSKRSIVDSSRSQIRISSVKIFWTKCNAIQSKPSITQWCPALYKAFDQFSSADWHSEVRNDCLHVQLRHSVGCINCFHVPCWMSL